MASSAFEKIKAGLEEAVAIQEGRADPATYRVHQCDETGKRIDVGGRDEPDPDSPTAAP